MKQVEKCFAQKVRVVEKRTSIGGERSTQKTLDAIERMTGRVYIAERLYQEDIAFQAERARLPLAFATVGGKPWL